MNPNTLLPTRFCHPEENISLFISEEKASQARELIKMERACSFDLAILTWDLLVRFFFSFNLFYGKEAKQNFMA